MSDLPPDTDAQSDKPPPITQRDSANTTFALENQYAAQSAGDQRGVGGGALADQSDKPPLAGSVNGSDTTSALERQVASRAADRALDVKNPARTPDQIAHDVGHAGDQQKRDEVKAAADALEQNRLAAERSHDDATAGETLKKAGAHDPAKDADKKAAQEHHR